MKKILLLIFLSAMVLVGYSQKVKIKKGMVSVDKAPFAQLEINKKNIFGIQDATIKSLDGKPILNVKNKYLETNFEGFYRWIALNFESGEEVHIPYAELHPTKKPIIKFLYNNEIITDGAMNAEAVQRLKEKYAENLADTFAAKIEEEKGMIEKLKILPERDTRKKVIVSLNRISQAGVSIGLWKWEGEEFASRIIILNMDSIPAGIMEGTALRTIKDGVKHTSYGYVESSEVNVIVRNAAAFMASKGYL